jgi:6-phosphogluconolactonase
MRRKAILNRREFLESASIIAAGMATSSRIGAVPAPPRLHMAIVGSMGDASRISVYFVTEPGCGRDWILLQELPVKAPVSILTYPAHDTLYVLNQIDIHEGLPRGTVEAYRLDRGNGKLTLLCRQPLSLSATGPRHMALSPGGASLAVAVADGGAYNVLPILQNGELGRVSIQRKETGVGPVTGLQDSAHPQSILFTPNENTMIASDLGSDRLKVFSIRQDLEQGIELLSNVQLPSGSGPRNMALHPDGRLLFVDHALEGVLSLFELNGPILTSVPNNTIHGAFGDALAMHRSGEFLYSAGRRSIAAWHIRRSESSSPMQSNRCLLPLQSDRIGPVRALILDPHESALYASTPHGVLQFELAPVSGRFGNPRSVASIQDAHSILFV